MAACIGSKPAPPCQHTHPNQNLKTIHAQPNSNRHQSPTNQATMRVYSVLLALTAAAYAAAQEVSRSRAPQKGRRQKG